MKRQRRRPAGWLPVSMRGRLTLVAVLVALVSLGAAGLGAAVTIRGYLFSEAADHARMTAHLAEGDESRAISADPARIPARLRDDPRLEVRVDTLEGALGRSFPRVLGPGTERRIRKGSAEALSLWPWTDPAGRTPAVQYFIPRGDTPDDPMLVVSSRLRYEQARLNATVRALIGTVAAITVLVAGATWWVAGRALRPVEAIRSRFADLTAHHLDQRVPVPGTDDEVARLARTMNATLDRLEAGVDQQRRFVADASHELRSPLAALRAELEIALAHPDRADWPDVVAGALGDTRRLQDLTTDLLLLARLDASGSPGLPGGRALDLTALVREETGRRRMPGHLTLRVEAITAGPVPLHGHHALLTRLLGNLLDNAERHAARAIEVRLAHDAAGRRAVLYVQDDGPGIPPADRHRVFERFTRLDDARTRDTGGTGLGLAIAHRIAGAHHGTLKVVDSPRGARFAVVLPTAPVRGEGDLVSPLTPTPSIRPRTDGPTLRSVRHRIDRTDGGPAMRLPRTAHTSRPWRIHEIAGDFRVEDVWALPTPGGPDDLRWLVRQFADDNPDHLDSPVPRLLFAVRWKLGKLLGWDKPDAGVGTRVATLRDRLPADLREGERGPDLRTTPFTSVFLTHDEWVAESANRTVHMLMHIGWVPDGAGRYRGRMTVLVKPNGLLGAVYMAGIKPFRYLGVYPALLRGIGRQWQAGAAARSAG
ncbi:DUF2867 domain-containing protein [Streptomyces sp. NPDC053048]|uniref:DUF2867 domain-containing protein n=1 Tax=Streptomyces sp. NPDC053048 TaxID=3365694 RepID=UPI0037D235EB